MKKTIWFLAAGAILCAATALAINEPEARFRGGSYDGYDMIEVLEIKMQQPKATTFTFR